MNGLTGILCAVDAELSPLLNNLSDVSEIMRGSLKFLRGKIESSEVVLVRTGMGKVNAAIAAQSMIDGFCPDRILISGVGGSLDKKLSLFDLVVCDRCMHHDLPESVVTGDYPYMESPWFHTDRSLFNAILERNSAIRAGIMVTGEKFIDTEGRTELVERFAQEGLLSVDMETAAVAQACRASAVPFCAVRAISDTEEECGFDIFLQNVAKAAEVSAAAIIELLA